VKIAMALMVLMALGCREKADLLVFNGMIHTANSIADTAEAMVIRQGRIVALGSAASLRQHYKPAVEKDLQGKPVYPGFIDSHCHFLYYGLNLRQTDLTGTTSPEDVIQRLKENDDPASPWVRGRGWDQNDWAIKVFPNKELLDNAFPDKPVYLVRVDGHAAWVNTKALEMARITAVVPEGGEVITDSHGATGILLDNAMTLVEKLIPAPEREEKVRALLKAQANCFAVGLTMVGDAGLDKDDVLLLDSLQQSDKLKMRVYAMLSPTTANIDHFINKGVYRTGKLTVRSIKMFADGALGSRGALLREPYSDDPQNNGIQVTSLDEFNRICSLAYEKGYQVNTHCIGDSAVSLVLDIYSQFLKGKNDLRWRIEHSQVVDPSDFILYDRYSIIPSVQTTHATSDMYWAGDRLGPERIRYAYAYQSLLQQNGWLTNGSDFPVEAINPLYGFYAAAIRKDLNGFPEGGYRMEEALSRTEALLAMTRWAAKACMEENETGSLEPGKEADFVILDRDIMTAGEAEIPVTRVIATYVGGERVFGE